MARQERLFLLTEKGHAEEEEEAVGSRASKAKKKDNTEQGCA